MRHYEIEITIGIWVPSEDVNQHGYDHKNIVYLWDLSKSDSFLIKETGHTLYLKEIDELHKRVIVTCKDKEYSPCTWALTHLKQEDNEKINVKGALLGGISLKVIFSVIEPINVLNYELHFDEYKMSGSPGPDGPYQEICSFKNLKEGDIFNLPLTWSEIEIYDIDNEKGIVRLSIERIWENRRKMITLNLNKTETYEYEEESGRNQDYNYYHKIIKMTLK